MSTLEIKTAVIAVADLGGGGALGALAPPAESMVKNLNLPFFFSMYDRYLLAWYVRPV